MDDEWSEFDLSTLTFPEFLAYFFDRPVVADNESYDLFRAGIDSFVASNATIVVGHVRAMCRDFARLTKVYSHEQLDQGLWAVFGAAISCERWFFDPALDTGLRTDAIESMYIPFRDVVAFHAGDVKDTFYWMWWDMILFNSFWGDDWKRGSGRSRDYASLTDDLEQMGEVILRTLLKILALEHRGCQWCALHGLGHLNHPSGSEMVQGYLDAHRSEFNDEDIKWIEGCRDGRVQ